MRRRQFVVLLGAATAWPLTARAQQHAMPAAAHVDRMLRGEKVGDLPFQQPTKYQLTINLRAAKALDLTVPEQLLALADEVIE